MNSVFIIYLFIYFYLEEYGSDLIACANNMSEH